MRSTVVAATAALVLAACGTTLHDPLEVTGPATDADASLDGTVDAPAAGGPVAVDPSAPVDVGVPAGGSGTTPSGPAAPRPTGPANTDPISLGFVVTEVGNAGSFGLSVGQSFTHRQIVDALVASLNSEGGLAGRRIQPVIDGTDTASISWEADFASACAAFTQDNHVEAVLGYAFAFFSSFESCLAKAGAVHLTGAYNIGDQASFDQFPTLFATSSLTLDRYLPTVLNGAARYGRITKATKLGVLLPECPAELRAWAKAGAPLAEQLAGSVQLEKVTCPSGSASVGSAVTQLQNAVLKFRSAGVDTVLVEGPALLIFAASAESQGWRPKYLASTLSGGGALAGNMPEVQAANVQGIGWLPGIDVSPARQPTRTAAQERCLALLRKGGLTPSQYNDFAALYITCDAIFLYEAALQATNGNSDAAAITAAIEALGSSYQAPSALEGKVRFQRGRHEGPTFARPWAWDAGCRCFGYTGEPGFEIP